MSARNLSGWKSTYIGRDVRQHRITVDGVPMVICRERPRYGCAPRFQATVQEPITFVCLAAGDTRGNIQATMREAIASALLTRATKVASVASWAPLPLLVADRFAVSK